MCEEREIYQILTCLRFLAVLISYEDNSSIFTSSLYSIYT